MEQIIARLRHIFPFKHTTAPGDIVLIAAKTPEDALMYAQVGDIARDETRKAEWWHVTLHLLLFPPQTVVWTLRTPQFTGQESFTMGGEGRFIQALALGHQPDLIFTETAPETAANSTTGQASRNKKGGAGLRLVK